MRFLKILGLLVLFLLQWDCFGCSNKKPISSQRQQPTPINETPAIPFIPPAPPADEPPSTPQSPETHIPTPGQTSKNDSTIIIWLDFPSEYSKKQIAKKGLVKRIMDVFKENKIEICYLNFNKKPINLNLEINDKIIDELLNYNKEILDNKMFTTLLISISKDENTKFINLDAMFCTIYSNYIAAIRFYGFPTLHPKTTQFMFMRCINLKGLSLPDMDYSNLEDCTNMFYGCSQLTLEGTNLTKQDISAFDNRLSHLNPIDKIEVFGDCPLGDHFHNK